MQIQYHVEVIRNYDHVMISGWHIEEAIYSDVYGEDPEHPYYPRYGYGHQRLYEVQVLESRLPDVVLMDMRLVDGSGAQATAEVLAVSPSSKVLVLSASDEREDVLEAVKAGATGYLVKSASKQELDDAVRATAQGRAVFTPGMAGLVLGEYRRIARDSASPSGPPRPSQTSTPKRRQGKPRHDATQAYRMKARRDPIGPGSIATRERS